MDSVFAGHPDLPKEIPVSKEIETALIKHQTHLVRLLFLLLLRHLLQPLLPIFDGPQGQRLLQKFVIQTPARTAQLTDIQLIQIAVGDQLLFELNPSLFQSLSRKAH
jgi:hypothetical protein